MPTKRPALRLESLDERVVPAALSIAKLALESVPNSVTQPVDSTGNPIPPAPPPTGSSSGGSTTPPPPGTGRG